MLASGSVTLARLTTVALGAAEAALNVSLRQDAVLATARAERKVELGGVRIAAHQLCLQSHQMYSMVTTATMPNATQSGMFCSWIKTKPSNTGDTCGQRAALCRRSAPGL